MTIADRLRNMTPRQRIAAGCAGACVAIAGVVVQPFEGRRLAAYPDVVYGWKLATICDGHTGADVRPDSRFTPAECDQLRTADLQKTYEGLLKCIGDVPMPDHELAAYLSVAYNVGPQKFCSYSFKTKLAAGDHAAACALISQLRFANGHDCASPEWSRTCGGIVRRRTAERSMCEGT